MFGLVLVTFCILLPYNAYRYYTVTEDVIGMRLYTGDHIRVSLNKPFVMTLYGKDVALEDIERAWLTSSDRCSASTVKEPSFLKLAILPEASTSGMLRMKSLSISSPDVYKLCLQRSSSYELITDPTMVIEISDLDVKPLVPLLVMIPTFILFMCTNALFSGMNMAFFCIPHNDIILLQRYNDADQNKQAHAILQIRKNSNWLVCTLVLGNTIVNTVSTLLIEDACKPLAPKTKIIVINVVPVLLNMFFGEIFPQAFVKNRGLRVARRTLWIAKFFMVLFLPVAYPLSRLLDFLIGTQGVEVMDAKKFEGMIKLQMTNNLPKDILERAFRFKDVTVGSIMTSINDAWLLSSEDILDINCLVNIMEMGYTRVPVYLGNDRGLIVALLNVKELIFLDPNQKIKVIDKPECLITAQYVFEEMPASKLMEEMISGHVHLCIVAKYQHGCHIVTGLITLEDIIEELIGEIYDDTDVSSKRLKPGTHDDKATLRWLKDHTKGLHLTPMEQTRVMQELCDNCAAFNMLQLTVQEMRKLISLCPVIQSNDKETVITKEKIVNTLFIVIRGSVLSPEGHYINVEYKIYGSVLISRMLHVFSRQGFKADVSNVSYVSTQDVVVIEGSVLLMMEMSTISSLLLSIHNEHAHKNISTKHDYYVNDLLHSHQPTKPIKKRKNRI
ncbi:unnamed protein product [Bursaphelenchus okinawaensis]|uniref:CNNM transmembrane domain-containing protein n=1 Tax=Bursaphelenchus okinawaensis TaxID=465554 RepID=A0A811LH90_9BILA|nr:unnamed protein product [Bursaphelenchus okinawaensis]CAG9125263.1 unnamed protein product [Bursaphelenchus okinawaensis]